MNSSILIADDEPNQVELISYNLQKSGFKTILAKNGQEVLDKTFEHKPDLLILDSKLKPTFGEDDKLVNTSGVIGDSNERSFKYTL